MEVNGKVERTGWAVEKRQEWQRLCFDYALVDMVRSGRVRVFEWGKSTCTLF